MGTVTTAILNEGESNEVQGRISYENRGECFFLPYGKGDIEGNVTYDLVTKSAPELLLIRGLETWQPAVCDWKILHNQYATKVLYAA